MAIKPLAPFRLWVLQNFPFIAEDFDALTNYELMCKIVEYLNNVINVTNEQTKAINDLETWFDNLDIQEEVDHKLDEMVESGELQEIISAYLDSKAILGFNTISDLKSATNLTDGSLTRTMGQSEILDGKGAFYRIRTLLVTDVIDDINKVSLTNYPSLVAEIIPNYYINELNTKMDNVETLYPYHNTKVHNIYGGQDSGNFQVIENEGNNTIIDFGTESGIATRMSYLITNNITTFKHAIITHYHIDHVADLNGIKTMINSNNFDFSNCVFHLPVIDWSEFSADMSTYQAYETELISFLTSKDIEIDYVNADKEIVFDINTKIKLTNTTYPSSYYELNNLNNFSIVTELIAQGKHILFASDIEKHAQDYLYDNYTKCDVLSVPHHGVDYHDSKKFLEKVYPDIAIIMNTGNIFPNRDIIEFLRANCIRTYASNYSQDVIIEIKNNVIESYSTNGEYNVIFDNNIVANTDFNDLTRQGRYYVADSTITSTLTNIPLSVLGYLEVSQVTASVIYQKYYCNTVIPTIWTRVYRNGFWSTWREEDLGHFPILIAKLSSQQTLTTSNANLHFENYYYERNNTNNDETKKLEILSDYTINNNGEEYTNTCKYTGQVVINSGLNSGDIVHAILQVGSTIIADVKSVSAGSCLTLNISETLRYTPKNTKVKLMVKNETGARGQVSYDNTYLKLEFING